MKSIQPYSSFQDALSSFDNGGHFYNLFSHAKDGVVSIAELETVAQISHKPQQLILFLIMSICKLDNRSREKVLSRLNGELFELYEKYRPVHITIPQMIEKGKPGISVTLVGTPKEITTKPFQERNFLIPVKVGEETSFTLASIEDSYVMYELHSEYCTETVLVAHPKEAENLPEKKVRLGGMLTAFNTSAEKENKELFLLIQYFIMEE